MRIRATSNLSSSNQGELIMGELIRREAASVPFAFSGERLTADCSGQLEIEHYHRYLLAREFCREVDVLDIAAGEGYGTALLAQVAKSAVGIEIDANVVAAAQREFVRPNLRFEQGDACAIPLANSSIDVAVSFETLEHLIEQDMFLAELRRVLRPGGLLIISTPDCDAYSPVGTPPNPYHRRELSRSEFEHILSKYFKNYALALQRAFIGSLIAGFNYHVPLKCYERRSDKFIEGSDHLAHAPYMLAFASDVALPPFPSSLYVYPSDLDTAMNAAQVKRTSEELAARLRAAEAQLEATALKAQEAKRRLQAIEGSSTWRATEPLRRAGERFPSAARLLRRAVKLAFWTITFQLFDRYRSWHQPRLLVRSLPPSPGLSSTACTLRTAGRRPLGRDIKLPSSDEPMVSVIISTYGQVGVTLACLNSIAEHPPRCSIEVLLVDDAYPGPEDLSELREVSGLDFSRNPTNLGYLRSCNRAALRAKGRYIHLLNNDTELQPRSIDAMVDLLEARPEIGMVGSKLLFPDGRLQEAGCILWTDASGWNYGRGDDSSRPEYNYVRDVDYCSGASIMVRRELFNSLGGFDEKFAPAYYEDADLAFRIRQEGMRVVYEPRSVIIHHEGMSHGTDVSKGIKSHQVHNQAHMLERWGTTLARENYASSERLFRARDRARGRKVILVVDHYVPQPDRDAGSRTIMGVLDCLIDASWVVKFWPHNRDYDRAYTSVLEDRGIEVLDKRWPGNFYTWIRAHGSELDHALVSRPQIAADILPALIGTDAVRSYYGQDLHFARIRKQAEVEDNPKLLDEAQEQERVERRIWRHFDLVIYPSDEEVETVRSMSPGTLARSIVPYFCETFETRSVPPSNRTILFVAGFAHPPNIDAAKFLVRQVAPLLWQEVGPVKIVLAGSNPTDTVRALAGPDVEVTGNLTEEQLAGHYARHRVAVVPLRFGAGVKGKVVEALGRGLPIVTTSTGIQGITGLRDLIPIRDDARGIADALKILLTDNNAWSIQSSAQLEFAQRVFTRDAMKRSVLAALDAAEVAVGGAVGAA
jgi:O-antigen biosynthesis protein